MRRLNLNKYLTAPINGREVVQNTKKYWLPNILTLVLVGLQILLLIIFRTLPPQTPLLYSAAWGDSRLVRSEWLWTIPTLSVAIVCANYFLVRFVKNDELLERTIFWTMPIFALLTLITLYKILMLAN